MRKIVTGILFFAGWFTGVWAQETEPPRQTEEGERPTEVREGVNLNEVLRITGDDTLVEPQRVQDMEKLQGPQQSEDSRQQELVQYSPDFEFNDGIYANFEMVKSNHPIPTARIVTDIDMFDREFFEKVTSEKEIVIYDDNGVKKVMETKDIWGYGRNGMLYINVGNAFHRISFVGSISHFVASVTTYNSNYYDPYYSNPYYSNSYYYNRYNMPRSNYANTELRQYLLDFETGDVLNYDTESMEVLLMKDPELADEYQSLRNRKKKQMKFVYIRKYNEKHPLYLPAN